MGIRIIIYELSAALTIHALAAFVLTAPARPAFAVLVPPSTSFCTSVGGWWRPHPTRAPTGPKGTEVPGFHPLGGLKPVQIHSRWGVAHGCAVYGAKDVICRIHPHPAGIKVLYFFNIQGWCLLIPSHRILTSPLILKKQDIING